MAARNESSVSSNLERIDYGIDGPGIILGMAVGAPIGILAGIILLVRGHRRAVWLVGAGLLWLSQPLLMLASAKWGKLRQRDAILDAVGLRGDERVLDVGTGHGLLAIGAAKRLTTGRAVGIDIWRQGDQADNALENTLRNVRLEGVADPCAIQDGDARAIPFPDASFDVVLASFALHNVPGAEGKSRACREIARVLKPGGRVFDYDMVFATGPFVRGFAEAGLEVRVSGLSWRTYPPGRLVVGRKHDARSVQGTDEGQIPSPS